MIQQLTPLGVAVPKGFGVTSAGEYSTIINQQFIVYVYPL
jgi:hypothetical protein